MSNTMVRVIVGLIGIPLVLERGGFYEAIEILDLLSLLQVLDNPLQDVPVLALLRSPLAGLTVSEITVIRLAANHGDTAPIGCLKHLFAVEQ